LANLLQHELLGFEHVWQNTRNAGTTPNGTEADFSNNVFNASLAVAVIVMLWFGKYPQTGHQPKYFNRVSTVFRL
jgi:hypothetical protein